MDNGQANDEQHPILEAIKRLGVAMSDRFDVVEERLTRVESLMKKKADTSSVSAVKGRVTNIESRVAELER